MSRSASVTGIFTGALDTVSSSAESKVRPRGDSSSAHRTWSRCPQGGCFDGRSVDAPPYPVVPIVGPTLTRFNRWSIDFQTITAGLSSEVELSEAVEDVLDRQPAVGHLNRQHLQGSEPDHIATSKEQRIPDGVV